MRERIPCLLALLVLLMGAPAAAKPLRVVATVPDLADLAEQVGGDEVDVFALTQGPQDPHFVEPRPSFVTRLHRADVFALMGMELEIGWAPVLLRQARNRKILPGGRGYLDASVAIAPLEVPLLPTDRSAGDVHPFGNPHYLTDPINGLRVAALLRDRFAELRPEAAEGFSQRYGAFAERLMNALVGAELVALQGVQRLAEAIEAGSLGEMLDASDQTALLGGWLGNVASSGGSTKAVQDHRMWAYFARRFGLVLVGELEPKPGIAPTTRHLGEIVERMQADDVELVLASPYFDVRHARWVAERSDARIAEMAHQVGSRGGTDDYLATVDYNVRQLTGVE